MRFLGFLAFILLASCVSNASDPDPCGFDSDTVHVVDGYHIKLLKFDESKIKSLEKIRPKASAAEKDYSKGIHKFMAPAVDLGMANVPVLDQGQHGTCVTFASTAALDAVLAQGDFISQQCSLELDLALFEDYWNGANYPSQIIDPLFNYGVVKKEKCDRQYPVPGVTLSTDEYEALVDKDASAIVAAVQYVYLPAPSLDAVKAALDKGHRVLTGFLLQTSAQAVRGFNVQIDGIPYQGGLWACKQGASPNYCANSQAGHEVLIIGYDDKQELLKIRNSWNSSVGDKGNYYMSYKFFKSMALDQTEVW